MVLPSSLLPQLLPLALLVLRCPAARSHCAECRHSLGEVTTGSRVLQFVRLEQDLLNLDLVSPTSSSAHPHPYQVSSPGSVEPGLWWPRQDTAASVLRAFYAR